MLLGGCGTKPAEPLKPDLTGTWVLDDARVEALYEVSSAPEGPERLRAVARVKRAHADLVVEFGGETVQLSVGGIEREVTYQVIGTYGPLVVVEGLDGTEVINTTLKLEGDHLTWFDGDGEVEFVLRRISNSM